MAAPPPPAPAETQVDATACQACHGANGISRSPRVPNLAGQQPDYLVAQLQAFRSGTRKNDLMEAIAAQLSDAEMTALAHYWNTRPAGGGDAHAAAAGPAIPSRMAFPTAFPAGFTLYHSDAAGAFAGAMPIASIAAARASRPSRQFGVVVINRPAAGASTGYAAMEARAGWAASALQRQLGFRRVQPSASAMIASTRRNASPATAPRRRTATSSAWRNCGRRPGRAIDRP